MTAAGIEFPYPNLLALIDEQSEGYVLTLWQRRAKDDTSLMIEVTAMSIVAAIERARAYAERHDIPVTLIEVQVRLTRPQSVRSTSAPRYD